MLAALDAADPQMVLVEGPADATPVLEYAGRPGLVPPVALLVYAEKAPRHCVFYPFAVFSPEWQAIRWALARGRPVRFIDLPASHGLAAALNREEEEASRADSDQAGDPPAIDAPLDDSPAPEEVRSELFAPVEDAIRRDPIGALADAAGHGDGEAWWNELIEEQTHAPEVFSALETAMAALRERAGQEERENRREAHMRLACMAALAETTGPVAAVVGAWHVPALRAPVKKAVDRAKLTGLPTTKVSVTWVPWTNTRLTYRSGYGAGVRAPGWYEHLWTVGERLPPRGEARTSALVTGWLVRAGRLLREQGLDASPASLIEAQRLSVGLAALEEVALPGLDLITEALRATVAFGENPPLARLERDLYVGAVVGAVGDDIPQNPLAADLSRQQKSLRLKPEALERSLSLDLRTDSGLSRSTLLHRLLLLEVSWGRLEGAGGSRGTFRENWTLRWDPESSVALAENVVYGTTIESAAEGRARAALDAETSLQRLAERVEACLLAGLDDAAHHGIARIQAEATASGDLPGLLAAVPPLASVLRYGTARRLPTEALAALVAGLVELAVVGLGHACRGLDEETAAELRAGLERFDEALVVLDRPGVLPSPRSFLDDLDAAFARVASDEQASPLLRGHAVRRRHDRGRIEKGRTADELSRALSPSVEPLEASAWLEGFIGRAGHILLHDEALLEVVDRWLTHLEESALVALLPMLRRAFASMSPPELRALMDRIRRGSAGVRGSEGQASEPSEAFSAALPLLCEILGWEKR